MPFRSFLYLDDEAVDDFLSQVEGGLMEGPYTARDLASSGKEGGISAKIPGVEIGVSGKGNTSSSLEVQRTIRDNPQAKFSRLYNILTDENELDEEDQLVVLNGFDQAIYDGIRVGEIIEVRGEGVLPQWEHLRQSITDVVGAVEMMKAFGVDPAADPQAQATLAAMTQLATVKGGDDTIFSVTPVGAPDFKIVAKLNASKLRRPKLALETEVTILGKVRRRLEKGEKIDVFRLLPHLRGLEPLFKTQQGKGPRGRIATPKTDSPLDEYIKYPAVEILPIAVYL